MLDVKQVIKLVYNRMMKDLRKRKPTEFFDVLLSTQVGTVFSKDTFEDIIFYPNNLMFHRIKPQNSLASALGVQYAMILQKEGFTIPQLLCNPEGYRFLCSCYLLDEVNCYIETNGLSGIKSRIITGAPLKEVDTKEKVNRFNERLESWGYPAYTLKIAYDSELNKHISLGNSKFTFTYPEINIPIIDQNGDKLISTSICPLAILGKVAQGYYKWAQGHLLNITYVKRDGSLRVIRTSLNRDILLKMYDGDKDRVDRVLFAFEQEKHLWHRGYIKVPDVDLPVSDASGMRSINITKVLDFQLTSPSRAKVGEVATKNCTHAIYVLINKLLNEELDMETRVTLAKHSFKEFNEQLKGIEQYTKAKTHFIQLPDMVANILNTTLSEDGLSQTDMDKKAYAILVKAFGEEQTDTFFEHRVLDLNNDLVDVNKEFNEAQDKTEYVNGLSKDKCVVIDYVKVDGSYSRAAFTKSPDIVDKVYGLGWRNIDSNNLLSTQIKTVEGYIDMVKNNFSAMFEHIAKDVGVNISHCKTLSDVKLNLERALNLKLTELKDRYVASRSGVKKRKAYKNIGGFTLTLAPEVLSKHGVSLWRSYKVDGIKSIFFKEI